MIRDLITEKQVSEERIETFHPKRGIFHEQNNHIERQFV